MVDISIIIDCTRRYVIKHGQNLVCVRVCLCKSWQYIFKMFWSQ